MKLLGLVILLVFSQVSIAKQKSKSVDFNSLIQQESLSQSETHKVISANIQTPTELASEKSKVDQNKIVFTRGNVHIIDLSSRRINTTNSKVRKQRISSTEKLEEDDYSRLDNELNSLR